MWFWYAIICMFLVSANSLAFRWLMNREQPLAMIIFFFKFVAAAVLLIPAYCRGGFALTLSQWGWLALIGILSNLGDVGQLLATKRAPNPGFAQAIIFTFPVLVLALSLVLPGFDTQPSALKFCGAVLCVAGSIVLAIPGKRSEVPAISVIEP